MGMNTRDLGIGTYGKDGRPRVSVGKGSAPRSCFSREYRANFDKINWGKKKHHEQVENSGIVDGGGTSGVVCAGSTGVTE